MRTSDNARRTLWSRAVRRGPRSGPVPRLMVTLFLLVGLLSLAAGPASAATDAAADPAPGVDGTLLSPGDAQSRLAGLRYLDRATGLCLDSNYAGEVYTLRCNGGNFQNWEYIFGILVNSQTDRCLDSNAVGNVYTLPCNNGRFQVWYSTNNTDIVNAQTLRCLDSNFAGNVYTLNCNGGDFQKWYNG